MEKTYERINWENYPSVVTPINEKNLNKMDSALDEVDNRVIGLYTAKLDKATANTMVKDVSFDENTGIFTITYLNGTIKKVDTNLEKIAVNFDFNTETQKMILTLEDGTVKEVDLSSLISQYEFTDSDFIAFTVDADGKVTATIKTGSITEDMLQPNFLADVKVEVEKAKKSSDSASAYAEQSKQYRDEAEQIKKEIEEVTDVEIATTEKVGIVKPDGDTITIDENGKISAKQKSGGASSWADLENKPFNSVGNGLAVQNEVLNVDMLKTMEEIEANEDENKLASALAVKNVFDETNKIIKGIYETYITTDASGTVVLSSELATFLLRNISNISNNSTKTLNYVNSGQQSGTFIVSKLTDTCFSGFYFTPLMTRPCYFTYYNGTWGWDELSLDNSMNVTTEEKIVGTWDGLPVYERLFRGAIDGTKTSTIVTSNYNYTTIQIISACGEVKLSSGSKMQLGAYLTNNAYSGIYAGQNNIILYHPTGCSYYDTTLRYVKL